jgi:hypothetical protein
MIANKRLTFSGKSTGPALAVADPSSGLAGGTSTDLRIAFALSPKPDCANEVVAT